MLLERFLATLHAVLLGWLKTLVLSISANKKHEAVINEVFKKGKKGIFPALSPQGIPYQTNGCDCGVFTSLYFWAFHSMAGKLHMTREWVQDFSAGGRRAGTQYEISEDPYFESFSQSHEVGLWREKMKEECERRKELWRKNHSSSSSNSSSSGGGGA